MKIAAIISALVAVGLAEEAKVLTTPLAYAGYPYAGLGYAGAYGHAGLGYAGAYGHAGLPYAAAGYAGYPYAAAPVAAPAPVVAAAPAVTYAAAPAYAYAAAPVAAPAVTYAAAPYTAGSQFHAQDEFGNLNYGYANINSVKQEVGNTYGGVTGGYSYVDANGELQQVQYIADGAGFRVADSRLPVAPVYDGVAPTFNPEPLVAPTFNPVLPVAPVDTPEVAEAKAAHLAAVAAAAPAERKRREAAFSYGFGTAHPTYAYGYAGLPHAAGLPYAAGLPHAGLGYAGLGYGLPYHG